MDWIDAGELLKYQFHRWYPLVRKHAMKCRVVDLPLSFKAYLEEDGMLLPAGTEVREAESQLSDDDELVEVGAEDVVVSSMVDLGDLDQRIASALGQLGGSAFIKLNFSAPTDAGWVNNGMKCLNVAEIYYVLKASERIYSDVTLLEGVARTVTASRPQPQPEPEAEAEAEEEPTDEGTIKEEEEGGGEPTSLKLVLKKWANFHPAMEFRAFVFMGQLCGISQRECSAFYEFLLEDGDDIAESIAAFVEDGKTAPLLPLFRSYVMDVYVDKEKRVWIVDIGPFGVPTDPLLFGWEELKTAAADVEARGMNCEMRVVQSETLVLQRAHNGSGGPLEAIDIARGILPHGFEYSKAARARDGRVEGGSDSDSSDDDQDEGAAAN
jgi:hypothetical protein